MWCFCVCACACACACVCVRVPVCVCVCVQKEEGGGGGRDGEVTNKNYCKSACTFLVFSPLRDWKERDAERMKKKIIKQTKPL